MKARYSGGLRFHYRCNGWFGWEIVPDGETSLEVCLKCGMSGWSENVSYPELIPRSVPGMGSYRTWMGDEDGVFENGAGLPVACIFEDQEHPFALGGDRYADYMNRFGAQLWKDRPANGDIFEFDNDEQDDEESEFNYGA